MRIEWQLVIIAYATKPVCDQAHMQTMPEKKNQAPKTT
jgi:hypothetical protein